MKPLIIGVGHHLPENIVRNEDLPASLEADPAGISKRTGIVERRWAPDGVYTSDLGTEAAKKALADAQLEACDIDCIIAATLSANYVFPGIGVYIQTNIGLSNIPAYDVRAQCSGFLYALQMARAFLVAGLHKRILVVCAELQSHGLGLSPKYIGITPLFGDGAGAVVVAAEPAPGRAGLTFALESLSVYADGSGADRLRQRVYDVSVTPWMSWEKVAASEEDLRFAEMDGQYIFRRAVAKMSEAGKEALKAAGVSLADVAWLLPHQANLNISKTVCSVLNVPAEKLLSNIERLGNTTAASIPILLSETRDAGRFQTGDRILMVAFGAGLTWGGGVLTVR
jgi:3-oxoacyl-[acyl-carrier-protein] synthase III